MPVTTNRSFCVPNTGDLTGAWGTTAVNPNFSYLDTILGGVTTLTPSGATTITLSIPPTTGTSAGANYQSNNALIKFTGTLSGNATINFTLPGYYIVHNTCGSATSYYIKLAPSAGTGNAISAPPGRKTHVFYDGTDMDFVDMPEVGSALDLHGVTSTPVWMSACTVWPYLVKDGSVYNVSAYPQLGAVLGSTFGGNGASTFGVPDERARARVALDTLSIATGTYAGRITAAGSGVNGTTLGAAGGSEFLQTHAHTASVTDPGHTHTAAALNLSGTGFALTFGSGSPVASTTTVANSLTGISVAVNGTGSGSSQNVMPVIVSFLPLIKT